MPETSTSTVTTDTPQRYIKQLGAHFSHKIEVTENDGLTTLTFAMGSCELRAADGAIEMSATAPSTEDLDRLEDVMARHLERFGARNELQVTWNRST